nr:surfeit locus protein 6 [Nothobranchius furzeri]
MDLAAKDSYIQKYASKLFSQREKEPKKRPFVHFKSKSDTDPSKKKKKKLKNNSTDALAKNPPKHQQKSSPGAQKSLAAAKSQTQSTTVTTTQPSKDSSFSTVNVLRKRLHEKIEESRGQVTPSDSLSEAIKAKRARRKLERERKKRKRKEFLMKKHTEQNDPAPPAEIKKEEQTPAVSSKRNKTAILFNNIETVQEGYETKMQKKFRKKNSVKGNMTPLTGRNYKQLLSRVEERKEKLEKLREKDEQKACEMEKKIKWTNLLYKAEGVKIKDNEDMLRASLKKKEKRHAQRKKQWEQRSEHVVEKMQQRQDKRKKNIQKRKQVRTEKKKDRARKKGRVLPEDLKKVAV